MTGGGQHKVLWRDACLACPGLVCRMVTASNSVSKHSGPGLSRPVQA